MPPAYCAVVVMVNQGAFESHKIGRAVRIEKIVDQGADGDLRRPGAAPPNKQHRAATGAMPSGRFLGLDQ